jgi:hypothetical protein
MPVKAADDGARACTKCREVEQLAAGRASGGAPSRHAARGKGVAMPPAKSLVIEDRFSSP